MKKKLWIFFLTVLTVCTCLAFGACGSDEEPNVDSSKPQQSPNWEDETILDQDHDGIELPEVERP